jgi:hypothetical protein
MKPVYKIALPIAILSVMNIALGAAVAETKVTPAKVTPTPVKQNPPLQLVPVFTPALLKTFTNSYSKIVGTNFTKNQNQQISQRLRREWFTNLGLRSSVLQIVSLEPQLNRGIAKETEQIRARIIPTLRQQVLDGDTDTLWLLSYYDAQPKNWLANGTIPLTQMTADTSADALCFMVNEIVGKQIASPDSKLKSAISAKLVAEYPTLSNPIKQELSKLTLSWLRFKQTEWIRRGEDFREEMRLHWGQSLEAYIPEIRSMVKLRRDRLAKLKADPQNTWTALSPTQKTNLIQQSQPGFQQLVSKSIPVMPTTIPLIRYTSTMQLGTAIASSPTRYPLRIKVK